MDIVIRRVKKEDARKIAVLHQRSWQAAYRGIMDDNYLNALLPDRWETAFLGHFDKNGVLKTSAPAGYLLLTDGVAAGALYIGPAHEAGEPPDVGEVYSVYLLPIYWGLGLGSKLLRHGLWQLAAQGYRRCVVWVLSANERARAAYQKEGFEPDGRTNWVQVGAQRLQQARYSCSLDQA